MVRYPDRQFPRSRTKSPPGPAAGYVIPRIGWVGWGSPLSPRPPFTLSSPLVQVPEGVWLVYGSTGWIGGMLCDMLDNAGIRYVRATSRLDAREDCAR